MQSPSMASTKIVGDLARIRSWHSCMQPLTFSPSQNCHILRRYCWSCNSLAVMSQIDFSCFSVGVAGGDTLAFAGCKLIRKGIVVAKHAQTAKQRKFLAAVANLSYVIGISSAWSQSSFNEAKEAAWRGKMQAGHKSVFPPATHAATRPLTITERPRLARPNQEEGRKQRE